MYRSVFRSARTYGFDPDASGGGAYGGGSGPANWNKGKAAKYDDWVPEEMKEKEVNLKDYNIDMRVRTDGDEDIKGVPTFKMKLVKKTQADIDNEKRTELVTNLSDKQRENMRRRKRKQIVYESIKQFLKKNLKVVNKGRSNIGFFNSGDFNIGIFNKGDHNKGLKFLSLVFFFFFAPTKSEKKLFRLRAVIY